MSACSSGNDQHSEWGHISEKKLKATFQMDQQQISLWNEGMKKYKLLNDWGLLEFVVNLERSGNGDVSSWHKFTDNELRTDSSFIMNEEQITRWKGGIQRYQLLSDWGLDQFADRMVQWGYADVSKWPQIPKETLCKNMQMEPSQLENWENGIKKYEERKVREQQLRTLMNLWELSQFADVMIQFCNVHPVEWYNVSDEKLTQHFHMESEHISRWKDGMQNICCSVNGD